MNISKDDTKAQPQVVLSDGDNKESGSSGKDDEGYFDALVKVATRPGGLLTTVNFPGLPRKTLQIIWQEGKSFMQFEHSIHTDICSPSDLMEYLNHYRSGLQVDV